MSVSGPSSTTGLGRPRRFDAETERRLLMDAALEVMTGSGYPDVTVADVLAEAGLSTRSFYRHFESKDALLVALMRRDAAVVGNLLDHAVDGAADPVEAVTAWLDSYLSVFYDPGRSRRTMLYASSGARVSPAIVAEQAQLREVVVGPLVKALRKGHRSGVLSSSSPRADAVAIVALVGVAASPPDGLRSRRAAREQVMRFAGPALRLPFS